MQKDIEEFHKKIIDVFSKFAPRKFLTFDKDNEFDIWARKYLKNK
jgi:hypothetical protein